MLPKHAHADNTPAIESSHIPRAATLHRSLAEQGDFLLAQHVSNPPFDASHQTLVSTVCPHLQNVQCRAVGANRLRQTPSVRRRQCQRPSILPIGRHDIHVWLLGANNLKEELPSENADRVQLALYPSSPSLHPSSFESSY